MAENGSHNPGFRQDIKQLLSEAKDKWLRPVDVYEILRNYQKFHIFSEAPNKPVSGSVFLFDRRVLRYFRKDGHCWRKKKDGKTTKEAHEKLKVGGVDKLNCYYAHGEDNEYFQRRSYWLLEQDLMHIVFVHYLEVKGNKTNISSIGSSGRVVSNSENNSSVSSSFRGASPTSILSPSYENAESESNHQASSRLDSFPDSPSSGDIHSAQSRSSTQILNPGNQNVSTLSCVSLSRERIPGVQETGEQKVVRIPSSEESLKKVDSFSSWIAEEFADEIEMQSSNGISRSTMGSEYDSNMSAQLQVDTRTMNPSVSLDQLFSIVDFSPRWAYTNLETKVIITGTFLKSEEEISKRRWSIMFGDLEVPAEVLADRFLCCLAPPHEPGVVSFYVTCSNRLACSEVREFEYRFAPDQNIYVNGDSAVVMHHYQRFESLLSMEPAGSPVSSAGNDYEKQGVVNKIISLKEEDNNQEANPSSCGKVIGELLLEKQLKEKFYTWIISADGDGINSIDKRGQSVLHLAGVLGFNWAFQPIIASGVSIDFRDVNGWTALHFAAFHGREETVAALVSLGASPGALTDPSSKYPEGRTPSELAYYNGHKGISGFLGETFLTTHLSNLRITDGGTPEEVVQKDSITAVCNATQAAARIHQFFRVRSFEMKRLLIEERESDAVVHTAAALQIQKKYRGYKKLKEFMMMRQKIVRIQAHVRGHMVRKKYKSVVWSVGILEKVVLRWRRKRVGLRGFRSRGAQEDDYEYLKDGRKQSEERMSKALSRVNSMAHYPEARAQYSRLLTAAEGLRENKLVQDGTDSILDNMEGLVYTGDDLIDVSSLLDDDTFLSLAF